MWLPSASASARFLAIALGMFAGACRKPPSPAPASSAADPAPLEAPADPAEISNREAIPATELTSLPLGLTFSFPHRLILDGEMLLGALTSRNLMLEITDPADPDGSAALASIAAQLEARGFRKLPGADDQAGEYWSSNGRPFPAAKFGFILRTFAPAESSAEVPRLSIEIYTPTLDQP